MSSTACIKILVATDSPVARAGLSAVLGNHADLEVNEANAALHDERSADPGPSQLSADVVVADYANGVALATRFAHPCRPVLSPKVMIVADSGREWEIRDALACGVRGYILHSCVFEELAVGVRSVHRGARHLSSPVAERLAELLSGEPLTEREEEVLVSVVDGHCNKAIAKQLGIAVGTVKSHLKVVFEKLGVQSRTQAVASAHRRGLLRDRVSQPHTDQRSGNGSSRRIGHRDFESTPGDSIEFAKSLGLRVTGTSNHSILDASL
jgi:DNA-binding NarL/FixJ family response regulator